ncbi:hypothetical protein GO613_11195 [Azoarcus communis]|uniref:putative porin n=1 Tax=Parazoarcus communis TaxID=41977 RepID=UPI001459C92B|nr:putative porin [Parazoarcus communis]NMG48671.1 hypothetical protein [Parazoarcus communis]
MKRCTVAFAIAMALAAPGVHADERESLETLRKTTLSLIDALVESGVLSRDKADALLKQAQQQAAATRSQPAGGPAPVRVPYIPESVRAEIRDQLRHEITAQARAERWAEPNAIPEWVSRLQWEGDIRVRYQHEYFDGGNTPAGAYRLDDLTFYDPSATRFVDAGSEAASGRATGNTSEDLQRWRIRARLGLLANISPSVSAGVRLSTGNTQDRVSTNQTLGQNFNKYSFLVDRAYLKLDPVEWFSASLGRIPNPWFSTDLVWDEDLSFEGLAATFRKPAQAGQLQPFATVGWFPLRSDAPPDTESRSLTGIQLGVDWSPGRDTRVRAGFAQYRYHGMEARPDPYDALGNRLSGWGSTVYGAGLRGKGNTLVSTNDYLYDTPATVDDVNWGLASRFAPQVLTVAADLAHFDPWHVLLSAEYVRNTAFSRGEIFRRTGLRLSDGSNTAYLFRVAVGALAVREKGEWQASLSYRRVGSDAVLDAFTDSDFGLGGTNLKGYTLGFNYGLDRNTVLGLRWMSADTIDSPTLADGHRFGVDLLQIDMSVKF